MNKDSRIPEALYMEDLAAGLNEIKCAIKSSGLTLAQIARGARVGWEVVYHASKGQSVRYDSARRIMFYLKTIAQ